MTMTLEQVRDWHREETRILSKSQHPLRHDSTELKALEDQHKEMADAIGAHIAAVREVIAELSAIISQGGRPVPSRSVVTAMRDKLEAAIQSILQGAGDE